VVICKEVVPPICISKRRVAPLPLELTLIIYPVVPFADKSNDSKLAPLLVFAILKTPLWTPLDTELILGSILRNAAVLEVAKKSQTLLAVSKSFPVLNIIGLVPSFMAPV